MGGATLAGGCRFSATGNGKIAVSLLCLHILLAFCSANQQFASGSGDPDLMRPEAVVNQSATYDLTLSEVTVVWTDSSNVGDENLTYYVTYSVTGRDTLIFNSSVTLNSTQLELVISGDFVQEGASFNITVQACNNFGLGDTSMVIVSIPEAFSPPPVDFTAVALSATSINLTWNSQFDQLTPSSFLLEYSATILSSQPSVTTDFNTTLTISETTFAFGADYNFVLMNLLPYSRYEFELYAIYGSDNSSAAIDQAITLEAAPGPVEDLMAVFNETGASYDGSSRMYSIQVTIDWSAPLEPNGIVVGFYYSLHESDATEFVISRTNTTLTSVQQNVMVAPFTNYTAVVQAFTVGGDGPEEMVEVLSPEAAPSEPQDLNVTVLSATEISVMWLEPEFTNGIIRNYIVSVIDENGITTNYTVDGSEQFTQIMGLDPYTLYCVLVRGVTVEAGNSSLSVVVRTDESIPSPVRSLSFEIINSTATISWLEPENPNGVLDYTVSVVGVSLTTDAIVLSETSESVNTSESIDIQPHSNYTVVVTSRTGAGEGTPVSINFQTPEEIPSPVRNLSFSIISSIIGTISWVEPENPNGVVNYTVFIVGVSLLTDATVLNETSETVTTSEDINIQPYSNYTVVVTSRTGAGEGTPVSINFQTPQGIPSPARNLSAVEITSSLARISWLEPDNPNGVVNYTVSVIGISLSTDDIILSETSETVTTSEDINIQPYSNYTVVVTSRTGAGEGTPVSINFQTPEGIPSAVRNLSAEIDLPIARISWVEPENPNGVVNYTISVVGISLATDATVLSETSETVTTSEDIDVQPHSNYTVVVTSRTGAGEGTPVSINFQTPEEIPSPARNLSAEIVNSTAIISWLEPENPNGVVNYTISVVGVSLTTDSTILNETSETVSTSEDINIQPHSNYTVVVTSRTGAGEGTPVSINFQTPEGIPSAVRNLSAEIDLPIARISWVEPENPNGVVNYTISVVGISLATDATVLSETSETVTTSEDIDVQPHSNYTVVVTSRTGAGEGTPVSINFQTPEEIPSPARNLSAEIVNSTAIISWLEPENPNGVVNYTISVVGVSLTTDATILNETSETVSTGEEINIQPYSNYTVVVTSRTGEGEGTPVSINFQTPEGIPSPARNLSAEIINSSARISWLEPENPNGVVNYTVSVVGISLATDATVLSETSETVTTSEDINIQPYSNYTVVVTSRTGAGEGTPVSINFQTPEEIPSPARNLSAEIINSSARISWLEPENPNGVVNYTVSVVGISLATDVTVLSETSETVTTSEDINIQPYSNYTVVVTSRTGAGEGTPVSINFQTPEEIPSPARNLSAEIINSSARISWLEPENPNGVVNYTVSVVGISLAADATVLSETSETVTTSEDINIQPYSNYTVVVTSRTGAGEGTPVSINFQTPEEIPSPARNLSAEIINSSARISWLEPENPNGVVNYTVSIVGISLATDVTVLSETSETVTTSEDINIQPHSNYTVVVTSRTGAGEGTPVSINFQTPEGIPSPVLNLSAEVNLSLAIISWVEPENPNGVLDYTVSVVGVSLTTDAIVLNDTLVTVNTSESIDIQPHSNYTVVVTSGTGAGEGTPVSINFQTPEERPSAVRNLTYAINMSSVLISWLEPEFPNGIVEYVVSVEGTNIASGAVVLNQSLSTTSSTEYLLNDVQPFSTYTVVVTSRTAAGNGDPVTITFDTPEGIPGSVENLTAAFATEAFYDDNNRTLFLEIEIAWDPPPPTNGIILGHRYSLQETDGPEFVVPETNTTSTAVEQNVTVAPYTNYTVAVSAFTAGGNGPQETIIILSPEAVPSPVRNLTAEVNMSFIRITWESPEFPNGIVTYLLSIVGTDIALGDVVLNESQALNGMDYLLESIQPYSNYTVTVTSRTGAGEGDPVTTSVETPQGPPGPVGGLMAVFDEAGAFYNSSIRMYFLEIAISWSIPLDPNGIILGYYYSLQESGGMGFVIPRTNTSLTSIELNISVVPYTNYTVEVQAFTGGGDGPEERVVVLSPEAVPSPVRNLTAELTDISFADISWEEPEFLNGIVTYALSIDGVSLATGNAVENVMEVLSSMEFQFDIQPYFNYTVVVTSMTGAGEGDPVPISFETPEGIPSAVRNLTVAIGVLSAVISWEEPEFLNGNVTYDFTVTGVNLASETIVLNRTESLTATEYEFAIQSFSNYTVVVTSRTGSGNGNPVATSFETLESTPGPVQNLMASFDESEASYDNNTRSYFIAVQISWNPPVQANGNLLGYNFNLSDSSDEVLRANTSQTSVEQNVTVAPFTNYTVAVEAFTGAGSGPQESLVILSPEAAPSPVRNVSVVLNAFSAQISWEEPEFPNGILTYALSIQGVSLATGETIGNLTLFLSDTEYLLEGTLPYSRYTVMVVSRTGAGDGAAVTFVFETPQGIPMIVRNLSLAFVNASFARIIWLEPAIPNGIVSYNFSIVGVDLLTGDIEFSDSVLLSDTEYLFTEGILPYSEYNVTVTAQTEAGLGNPVEISFQTPQAVPTVVRNLTSTFVNASFARIAWLEPVMPNGIVSYNLSIVGVDILTSDIDFSDSVLLSDTDYLFTEGIQPYSNYTVTVTAQTEAGAGDSVSIDFETPQAVPTAVRNLTATSNATLITVTWEVPEMPNGVVSYAFSILGTDLATSITVLNQSMTLFSTGYLVTTGTEAYSMYIISVTPMTVAGEGTTESTNFSTPEGVPEAPESFTAEEITNLTVLLAWQPPADANGVIINYTIELFVRDTSNSEGFQVLPADIREYGDFSLEPFTNYTASVFANTSVGAGDTSTVNFTSQIGIPESAPQNLQVVPQTLRALNVSWESPEIPNGPIISYTVEYFAEDAVSEAISTANTSIVIQGLLPFTTYIVQVQASTEVGCGPFSQQSALTLEEAPTAPLNLIAVNQSATVILVQWDPPEPANGIIALYIISYYPLTSPGDRNETNVSGTDTEVLIENLTPFTDYTFFVSAVTVAEGPQAEVSATTSESAPSAPVNVAAASISSSAINVTWEAPLVPNGIVRGYQVTYYQTSLGDANSTAIQAGDTFVVITGLQFFTEYAVFVQAVTIQLGMESDTVMERTNEDRPGPPSNFAVEELNSTVALVSWSTPDSENGIISNYTLYYAEDDGGSFINEISVTIAAQQGIEDYAFTVMELTEFTRYRIQVSATTGAGEGSRTQEEFIQTDPDSASEPTMVVASALNSTAIELTWGYPDDPRGLIQGYTILHNATVDSSEVEINITLSTVNDNSTQAYQFIDLSPFTYYLFRVAAYSFSDAGDPFVIHLGRFSDPVVEQTNESLPTQPRNFQLTPVEESSTQLQAMWLPPEPANGEIIAYTIYCRISLEQMYEEQRPEMENIFTEQFSNDGSELSAMINGLLPFTNYDCYVTAGTSVGEGSQSNNSTARTSEAAPSDEPQQFMVDVLGPRSITFQWSRPTSPNGIITGYTLVYDDTNEIQIIPLPNVLNYTLDNLNEFTNYTFFVSASTSVGMGPNATDVAMTQEDAPSSSPQNVVAFPVSSTSIMVTWDDPPLPDQNGIIDAYNVTYVNVNRTQTSSTRVNDRRILLTNLEEFEEYSFQIAAITILIGPFSDPESTLTYEDVPTAPPQNILGEFVNATSLMITWEPPPIEDQNGIILGYNISYNISATGLNDLFVLTTQVVIGDLEEFTYYSVSVGAATINGTGPFTSVVARTDSDVPSAPRELDYVNLTSTAIEVTWLPPDDPNGIVESYILMLTFEANGTSNNITDISATTLNVTGLLPYQEYTVVVYALTDRGAGSGSVPLNVLTDEDRPFDEPQDLSVTVLGPRSIMLQWSEPATPNGIITGYTLTVSNVTNTSQVSLSGTDLTYCVDDLNEFTNYTFNVTSSTRIGEGPAAMTVAQTDEDVPSASPGNVVATAMSSTSIMVTWDDLLEADRNGIIISYTVVYTNLNRPEDQQVNTSTSQRQLLFTDLHEYEEYSFRVAAETMVGEGPFSDPSPVFTLEDAPSDEPQQFMADVLSPRSIMLQWSRPTEPNGIITGYTLVYDDTNEIQIIALPNVLNYTLDELNEFTNYMFLLSASTSVGMGPNATVTAMTQEDVPSSSPQNVVVFPVSSTSIMVTWDDPPLPDQNGIIDAYNVTYVNVNHTQTNSTRVNDSSILLANLEEFEEYSFEIAAITILIGPFSDPVSTLTYEDVPTAPPQNILGEFVNATSLMITWEPPPIEDQNGIILGYNISYNISDTELNELFVLTTSVVIGDLEEFTYYNVSVGAATTNGTGPFTSVVARTDSDVPSAPQEVDYVNLTSTAIEVTWMPPNDPNGIVESYILMLTFEANGTSNNITDISATTLNVTGLLPYQEYTVVVYALTDRGAGSGSIPLNVLTDEDRPSDGPQNLIRAVLGPRTIMLQWSEPATPNGIITGYTLTISNASGTDEVSLSGTDLNYRAENLNEFTVYTFNVTASTRVGDGPTTMTVARTDEDVPSASPGNVVATAMSSTSIMVTWDDLLEADRNGIIISYTVVYTNLNRPEDQQVNTSTSQRQLLFTDLHEYEEYSFRVAAETMVGEGPFSDPSPVFTLEDVPSGPPLNLAAENTSSTSLRVTWEPPLAAERNGIIIFYTVIYVSIASSEMSDTISNTAITLEGLSIFEEYNVSVSANTINGSGPLAFTMERTSSDIPTEPLDPDYRNLTATSIEVTWSPPANPNGIIERYDLEYTESITNTPTTIEIPGDQEAYNITNLMEYERYVVRVFALTDRGRGPSSVPLDVLTDQHLPDAPDAFMVEALSSTAVRATWEEPLDSNGILQEYSLNISIMTTYLSFNTLNFRPSRNEFSIEIGDLHPFADYFLELRARTDIGLGSETTFSVQTLEAAPSAGVTDVQASVNSSTVITVSWLPPTVENWNGIITSYNITYYAVNNCSNQSPVDPVMEQVVEVLASENFQNSPDPGIASDSGGLQIESIEIRNLEEFQSYVFSVSIATAEGSNPGRGPSGCDMTLTDAPSESPTDIQFLITSETAATVSWMPPPERERNGIIVAYAVMLTNANGSESTTMNVSDTSITLTVLTPFTNYDVSIAAITSAGIGPFSDSITNMTSEGFPEMPSSIRIITVTTTTITVAWTSPNVTNGILGDYIISYMGYKEDNDLFQDFLTDVMQITTDGMMYTLVDLVPDTFYNISVSATTGRGTGPSISMNEVRTNSSAPPVLSYDDFEELVPMLMSNSETGEDIRSDTSFSVQFSLPTEVGINGPIASYRIFVRRGASNNNNTIGNYYQSEIAGSASSNPPQYAAIQREVPPTQRRARRQTESTPIMVSIGDPAMQCGPNDEVCNGPLSADTDYRVRYRLIAENGLSQDYDFSDDAIFTTAPSAKNNTGIIAGVVIALVIVVLIVAAVLSIVVVLRKKKHGSLEISKQNGGGRPLLPRPGVVHTTNNVPFLGPSDPGIVPLAETRRQGYSNPHSPTTMSTSHKIHLRDFASHVMDMTADSGFKFSEEYEHITEIGLEHAKEASLMGENRAKNRYTNILAYDHSRVKLSFFDDEPGSDYINGSYIPGYRMRRAYIATQGPLPATFDDFWRMVWEQNTHTIVMLTQLVERGRTKCHRYWPGTEPQVYGDIAVVMESEKEKEDWTVRTFRLSTVGTPDGKKIRLVHHFQFTSWPDHGVPESPIAALDFVKTFREVVEVQHGPIVVHCSAGVGRTGCCIALDTLLQHIKDHDWIDIFALACEMRQHRNHMIQTEAQYVFIHKAMLDVVDSLSTFKGGNQFISSGAYPSLYVNQFADDSTQMSDYYGEYLSEETHM